MIPEKDLKFMSRRKFLRTAAAGIAGITLAACGSSGGGGAQPAGGGAEAPAAGSGSGSVPTVKWSTWGNPGEIERFKQYTDDFNKRTPNIKAELVPLPNDGYEAKMLTQLSGGTAPDMFYAGDGTIGKLIENKTVTELTSLLDGPASKSKPADFYDGLWGAAKTADGKIWGVTVDCNPMVLWFNKKLLQEAGITTMPTDLQKDGKWTWTAFTDMTKQLVAKEKRGLIIEYWWAPIYSWVTTNGGKVFDGENYVAASDAKAVEGFKFIADNLANKNFTYSGSLPKGQGVDAMFMSQQVGFVGAGRWLLPVFKKNAGLDFDFVTYPTNTGKKIEPAGIPTAYAVLNAKSANPDAAFALLTDFVSKEGQTFRLTGGGNAVPSIKGADAVVSEGNLPPSWQMILDAREVGYALWPAQASVPGLGDDINKILDELWLKGGDVNATLEKVGAAVTAKTKK
jgi:multiple sugar transport system substrate-binding protein